MSVVEEDITASEISTEPELELFLTEEKEFELSEELSLAEEKDTEISEVILDESKERESIFRNRLSTSDPKWCYVDNPKYCRTEPSPEESFSGMFESHSPEANLTLGSFYARITFRDLYSSDTLRFYFSFPV